MNNTFSFTYRLPTEIIFGRNAIEKTGKSSQELGKKALVIITKGGSMRRYGYLDKLLKSLEKYNISSVVYDKVSTNPTVEIVRETSKLVQEQNCDFVIGLGGGSAIDVAKVTAACAVTNVDPKDYTLGIEKIEGALPIVAIPTTHGTGTEVNKYAVLTDTDTKAKRGIASTKIYPKVAIIDPLLSITLPKRLSAATVVDALSHAIEAYVKKEATKISMIYSEEAIKTIFNYGPQVIKDPTDVRIREHLLWASMCAGISIDIAGTTLCHGLEHPVSALFNAHHGEGLAALLVPWARFTRPAVEKHFGKLALMLGLHGNDIEELSYAFIEEISVLIDRLKLNLKLRDFGVKEKHIDLLVENALSFMKYNIDSNPRPASRAEIRNILLEAL